MAHQLHFTRTKAFLFSPSFFQGPGATEVFLRTTVASCPVFLIKGFAAVVLGGMGNLFGAVIAGFLIGIFEAYAAGLISSSYKDAIALIALIFILVMRPSGLFGGQARE